MAVAVYAPRSPTTGALYQVVQGNLRAFLAQVEDRTDGIGLPSFVTREFRKFLGCGVLSRGFARVRCPDCAFERLIPFSCKGRGFCPSCGGRRMTERAAHLVDRVFPDDVPVRQWLASRITISARSWGLMTTLVRVVPRVDHRDPAGHDQRQ